MTKKQCMKNIKEMINQDVKKYLVEECNRLLMSGGISISEELKDHYGKAKAILHVACINLSEQYRPLASQKDLLSDVKNLQYF
uniref:Uncharacterized protein n=1 Tax=viral metagenome TaxID=1070528 RepID=A0A6H1Z8Q5_9ZZZZ